MLVSVAIFAIVVTMIMGTIVTIVDASRKARTMTEVMNNLNFSFESMTRTLKTAKSITAANSDSNSGIIQAIDQKGRTVVYLFTKDGINKQVTENGVMTEDKITAADLKLSSWKIEKISSGAKAGGAAVGGNQPRVFFSVKGRIETTRGIYSEFNLQSTVSQRQLQL